jgi:hypothetical protein
MEIETKSKVEKNEKNPLLDFNTFMQFQEYVVNEIMWNSDYEGAQYGFRYPQSVNLFLDCLEYGQRYLSFFINKSKKLNDVLDICEVFLPHYYTATELDPESSNRTVYYALKLVVLNLVIKEGGYKLRHDGKSNWEAYDDYSGKSVVNADDLIQQFNLGNDLHKFYEEILLNPIPQAKPETCNDTNNNLTTMAEETNLIEDYEKFVQFHGYALDELDESGIPFFDSGTITPGSIQYYLDHLEYGQNYVWYFTRNNEPEEILSFCELFLKHYGTGIRKGEPLDGGKMLLRSVTFVMLNLVITNGDCSPGCDKEHFWGAYYKGESGEVLIVSAKDFINQSLLGNSLQRFYDEIMLYSWL